MHACLCSFCISCTCISGTLEFYKSHRINLFLQDFKEDSRSLEGSFVFWQDIKPPSCLSAHFSAPVSENNSLFLFHAHRSEPSSEPGPCQILCKIDNHWVALINQREAQKATEGLTSRHLQKSHLIYWLGVLTSTKWIFLETCSWRMWPQTCYEILRHWWYSRSTGSAMDIHLLVIWVHS